MEQAEGDSVGVGKEGGPPEKGVHFEFIENK